MDEEPVPDPDALIERIREAEFSLVRSAGSYSVQAVDDFLDGLAVTLEQGGTIEPLIALVRFTTVRLRAGYDPRQVDEFLAAVSAASVGEESPEAPGQPEEDEPEADEEAELPTVIEERRGILVRLFGR